MLLAIDEQQRAPGHRSRRRQALGCEANRNRKGRFVLNLIAWESTIETIVREYDDETNEARKHKALIAWRVKLSLEPILLKPFQIDEIIREVRRRLGDPVNRVSSEGDRGHAEPKRYRPRSML